MPGGVKLARGNGMNGSPVVYSRRAASNILKGDQINGAVCAVISDARKSAVNFYARAYRSNIVLIIQRNCAVRSGSR